MISIPVDEKNPVVMAAIFGTRVRAAEDSNDADARRAAREDWVYLRNSIEDLELREEASDAYWYEYMNGN